MPPDAGRAGSKVSDVIGLLHRWCEEYGIDSDDVQFGGYEDLVPQGVMGKCYYFRTYRPLVAWVTRIDLDSAWEDRRLGWLERSVLWHEMAHAIAYLEDGDSDDHNSHWRDLRRRKPVYVVGDAFAKLLWPIIRR